MKLEQELKQVYLAAICADDVQIGSDPQSPATWTAAELIAQFRRCQQWHDPEQWDILALFYMAAGNEPKAVECLRAAEECREPMTAAQSGDYSRYAGGQYAEFVEH